MAELSGDEAHHLVRVMRQKPGDMVTLFDGNGHEFCAEITGMRKDCVSLRLFEVRIVDTEPQRHVTVAVSLPKGERQKWLVEKLTELGCHRLIPLQTERGVAQCSELVIERLHRQVLEATKQCNRGRLMQILPEQTITDCVDTCKYGDAGKTSGWIAHPRSDGDFGQWKLPQLIHNTLPKQVLVLVGPEGGFTHQEVENAIALGLLPLDLGPCVLQVETAALMLTAIMVASV
jgi:16S rRNA (uracil1498-N3)-methyltransferase